MPLKLTLPPDLERRLDGLGEAVEVVSAHVLFAYGPSRSKFSPRRICCRRVLRHDLGDLERFRDLVRTLA